MHKALQMAGLLVSRATLILIALAFSALPILAMVLGSAVIAGVIASLTGAGPFIAVAIFLVLNLFLGIYVFPPMKPRLAAAAKVLARD